MVAVDARREFFVLFLFDYFAFCSLTEEMRSHRPSAQEFVRAVLESLEDLPEGFVRRFVELVAQESVDRSQSMRQLFEESAGD